MVLNTCGGGVGVRALCGDRTEIRVPGLCPPAGCRGVCRKINIFGGAIAVWVELGGIGWRVDRKQLLRVQITLELSASDKDGWRNVLVCGRDMLEGRAIEANFRSMCK